MIVDEISQKGLSFYIITNSGTTQHLEDLIKDLRKIEYRQDFRELPLLEVQQYEHGSKTQNKSTFVAFINNNIVLKDENGIGIMSESYSNELCNLFPESLILEVTGIQTEGERTAILRGYKKSNLVLHLRCHGYQDIIYDQDEIFIPESQHCKDDEVNIDFVLTSIENILSTTLSTNTLEHLNVRQYNQIKYNELAREDKITQAISDFFPNTSNTEITSASVGRGLRSLLNNEQQFELFPSKKELQNLLCLTTQSILSPLNFIHKVTHHELKNKGEAIEERIGFYYVNGNIDLTYSIDFLSIEKLVKKWAKEFDIIEGQNINLKLFFPLTKFFHTNMSFNSYSELGIQYYFRVKYLVEKIIPLCANLDNIEILNNFINSEGYNFQGHKKSWQGDTKIIIGNAIIAALANDDNFNHILYNDALKFIDDNETRVRYKEAFGKLRELHLT